METLALIIIALFCWSIARKLKRIVRLIETMKVTIEIPIYGEDPDPEEDIQPERKDNVVAFGKRIA